MQEPLTDIPILAPPPEFPAHGIFAGRVPGVDVAVEKEVALALLAAAHQEILNRSGFGGLVLATAEQTHGAGISILRRDVSLSAFPVANVDGLLTNRRDVCLTVFVADCAAVYLARRGGGFAGLLHSGKKGTEAGITTLAIRAAEVEFGVPPGELVVWISPCIRPPHYEVDFAAEIRRQASDAGAGQIIDEGSCTAADPARFYSYRREHGKTGRMLAALAL